MKTSNYSYHPSILIKCFLLLLFFIFILMPIYGLFVMAWEVDIIKTISGRAFLRILKQSLYVASIATCISVLMGGGLAWAMVRTKMPHKGIFALLLVLPMLIPSLSHGMGLVLLYGANGMITNLIGINWNIYGFWGIIIGFVMYSFPVAYLMIADILKYEDSSAYEAAYVLGFSFWDRFFCITLPYMYKPLISVVFIIFTMAITDYGVPLMVGGKYTTLAVLMYQDVIGLLDFSKGSVIGIVLLVPALIAFLIDFINQEKGNSSFVKKPFNVRKRFFLDKIAILACTLVSVFVLLPIASFGFLSFIKKYPVDMTFSFANILYSFKLDIAGYLFNSIIIAFIVSCIGVMLASCTGYITARTDSKYNGFFHLISIATLAIPGIVLGLSYILFFKSSFLYGTFAILIFVNIVHFFASPYLMIHNTFHKINKNLESVGRTLGLSRMNIIKDVILPQAKGTLLEIFAYFFINSMVTISAVAFLATVENKPLSLMISRFEADMLIEAASFVSLLILTCNIMLKVFIEIIKKRFVR